MKLTSVTVEGCAGYWCGAPEEQAKLESLVDVKAGETWRNITMDNARDRLEQTGFFRAVELHCALADLDVGPAEVTFRLHPHRWIRRVEIEGNKFLFESDVSKRLFLRPGRHLDPDVEIARQELERQVEVLRRRYQKEGFDDPIVTITPTNVGLDQVDLLVSITEGAKKKVSGIEVLVERKIGMTAASSFGADIACPTFTRRQIRVASELQAGDIFTGRLQRQTRRKVVQYLRAAGVVEPKVSMVRALETGVVTITVEYDRCFVLRYLTRHDPADGLSGFVSIDEEELAKVVTFGESGVFYLEEAERTRREIESFYQRQGYLFTDVRLDYRRTRADAALSGVRGVASYYITLGYQSEIRAITLHGNHNIADSEILGLFQTKTYDFFSAGGYLLVEQMFGDLHQLRRLYQSRGYYKFRYRYAVPADLQQNRIRVTRDTVQGEHIYTYTYADLHFRLQMHPEESVIYLIVDVDEGPLSKVEGVEIEGAPSGLEAELRIAMALQPGSPYSAQVLQADRSLIEKFFQKRGHHKLQLETTCVAYGEGRDTLAECDWRTIQARAVKVRHVINAGPALRVGEVFIHGNESTDRDLIEAPLPKPGMVLDRTVLEAAERRIRALGVFSDVEVKLIGLEQEPVRQRIAIVVSVHERHAQFIELATGFEPLTTREGVEQVPALASAVTNAVGVTDSTLRGPNQGTPLDVPSLLFFGDFSYRHLNFLGWAQEIELPLRYGFSFPADFADSESWGGALSRLVEFRPTWYDPTFLDTDVTLAVGAFGRYDRATRLDDELEFGGTLTVSARLADHYRTALTLTASGIQVGRFPADLEEEVRLIPKLDVDLSATIDFLNNPIHPTRGFAVGARLSYIFAEAAGLTDETVGNFFKLELNAKGVVSIREFAIFAAYVRFATSFSFNDEPLPEFERYLLGGLYGLRGIEDATVRVMDPVTAQPIDFVGGNSLVSGSVELRLPVLKRESFQFWLGVFVDVGALAIKLSDMNSESVRFTAGIGVRVLIGGIPIRLDLGFNLDRRCNAATVGPTFDERTDRCTAGKEALTDTQIGLLYTF